jgi:CRP-like cAMP-binding protein
MPSANDIAAELTEREHADVQTFFVKKSFKKDERIFVEGESAPGLVLLETGNVVVSKRDQDGDDQTLAILAAPCVLGELELIVGTAANATVTVKHEATARVLPTADFDRLVNEKHGGGVKMLRNIARALGQKLMNANELYADVMTWRGR